MKICFVGQRLYFDKQVNSGVEDAVWLEVATGIGDWNDVLKVDADIFVFFMPHQVPHNIRRRLRGIEVAVHAEPIPKFIDGNYITSKDIHQRYLDLAPATNYKHFYHHDKTSFPVLEREGMRPKEFISAISTKKFHPMEMEKKWDLLFFGRETQHRLDMLLPSKHLWGDRFLHIAHGVNGAELNTLMNMSKIGINAHCEALPALENRMQACMAAGLFVMSEPLSHNDFFVPGQHFVEFRDSDELIRVAKYYLEREDEREAIAQAGFDLVTQNLAAHIVWPRLIKEVLESVQGGKGEYVRRGME